jgi:hypothetical protein
MAGKIKTQLVIEGKNNASKAFKEADSQLLGISSAAKKAGASLLATFSVAAIGVWVKSSITASDQARKTAQSIGLTTESFTGLQFAASQSGVASNEFAGAMTRLSRSLSDAATKGGIPAEIFSNLGISVLNAEGNLRSADEVLADLADTFQNMPNGVEKTAAAVELLGRSGARLIPLLNGGSEGIKALTDQAERLGLVISDEQAAASERFNDNIAAIGGAARGASNTIAGELLPTLNEMSGLLLDLVEDGESAQIMADGLSFILKSLATVVIAVSTTFANLGRAIGGTAAAAVTAARGDFSEAGQIFREVTADNEKATAEAERRIKKIWEGGFADAGRTAAETVKKMRELEDGVRESAERSNKAFAGSYTAMVSSAKSALKELISEEKKALKDLEDLRQQRVDIEEDYAGIIARFSGGNADSGPSFNSAQDLTVASRRALVDGDFEGAAKKARAAVKVLTDLADAGENTFGFAGFVKQLKGIELAAKDIEKTNAEAKLQTITDKVAEMNTKIEGLTEFDIKLELTEAEKQKIISQMEDLRKLLGQPIPIQAQLSNASAPVEGFASGGRISGPGSGTSDSIMARLSNGEYVVKAAAVRKYGSHMLDSLNGMRLPKYADGGLIGSVAEGSSSGSTLNLSLDGQNYALNGQADTIADLASAVRKANLKRR